MTILKHPNETLRKRAEEVAIEEIKTPKFQKLIDDMIETMYTAKGIGLAGPQVGVLKRLLIAERGEKDPIAFINPKIVSKSWRKVKSEEGCLSVPGKYGIVKRHAKIKIKAITRDGQKTTIAANGLLAIILQHEVDHLNGILFIDKALEVFDTEKAPNI